MSGRHTLRRLLIASAVGLAGMLAVPWVPAADAAVLVSIDVTPSLQPVHVSLWLRKPTRVEEHTSKSERGF